VVTLHSQVSEGGEEVDEAREGSVGERERAHVRLDEPPGEASSSAREGAGRCQEVVREVDAEDVEPGLDEGQGVTTESAAVVENGAGGTGEDVLGEPADLLAGGVQVAVGVDVAVVAAEGFDVPGGGGHVAEDTLT